MENATDALIMAGSVLLLIIALTVTISSLSNLRTQAQDILMERDRLEIAQDSKGYINYIKNEANKYISQYKDFKETHDKIESITSINQLADLWDFYGV